MQEVFSSLIGHENVKKFLLKSLENGRLAHAYLFVGPENIGKTKAAECFAFALLGGLCTNLRNPYENYENPLSLTPSPSKRGGDGVRDDFQNLKNNPDFVLIEREINEETGKLFQNITINQIRELNARIQSTSLLGGRKVVIIKDADLMTLEAANAFLKNLEEPKGETAIILLVSNIKNLPETIVSRCQVVYFHPVPSGVIKEYLIKLGADFQKADLIVSLSGSRPGLALRFLKDKELLQFYEKQMKLFLELFGLPLSERLNKTRKMAIDSDKENLYTILSVWMVAARRRMRESLNADAAERIHLAMSQIRANVNPKLVMENLVINL